MLPGQQIGDFRLQRKLGQGGMGQVWEAQQISLDRPVALKLLPSDRMPSETQLALFEREARAGGRLHHPSIVSVLSYGTEDGFPYIAQELIGDGWSLANVLQDAQGLGDLPNDWCRDVAQFFACAAEALAVAHGAGVLHRDLKPENILVGEDTRPVIADFGLASVSGTDSILCTGDLTGTFAYMSPEQALAKRIGIDHRTDIYALGATFYEALTLRRAVEGDSHQQITENIIFSDPPTPHSLRSRIPVDLSLICMKALEKRRRDRYQSMAELALDLRRWLANETILARPAGPARRALRWVTRHRAASLVLGVALLSAGGFAWLSGQLSSKNDELGHSLDRVELLGADLKTALTDARQEKENVLRLSAFQELEDLRAEADSLWPSTPDRLPAYEDWLARASTLVAGLYPSDNGEAGHRQQLATLRARALPRSEEQRQAQRQSHPFYAEWEQERDKIESIEAELTTILSLRGDAAIPAKQAAEFAAIRAQISKERELLAQLDATIDERQLFSFVDAKDTWWQNQLVKLVAEIEGFANPETGLFTGLSERWGSGIERRRAFALTVQERTLSGANAQRLWADATDS
ncbi:MAG: serine/threonine protein kinase, partial [Pseudohongiellaceae bacterium]